MVSIGYTLSSEELGPRELVRNAQRAEDAGFEFAMISDHFHPWLSQQGQSPFVWSVIGGIAASTTKLRVGTGVTCPTLRVHPAIVAQAAATAAAMMPGRFMLGLGSGEALNEHITGAHWPTPAIRLARLEEAITIIRRLWSGEEVTHHGCHYTVEDARLFTLPDESPPILVAAAGSDSARLAAANDGLVATAPDAELVSQFAAAGGSGKPRYAHVTISWAPDERSARQTAHRWWPTAVLAGPVHTDIATTSLFDSLVEHVDEDRVAREIPCGPDPAIFVEAIGRYTVAGFDHIYLHQVGPEQDRFLAFFERELAPRLR